MITCNRKRVIIKHLNAIITCIKSPPTMWWKLIVLVLSIVIIIIIIIIFINQQFDDVIADPLAGWYECNS